MNNPKEQFSLIYDQYIEKIYRFVYVKVNSREVAEDVTSKVFLNGWQAYQKNQDIKNPGAFLYQIARNAVVDHYREKGRTKVTYVEDLFYTPDTAKNPYEKAIVNADAELTISALGNLKKEYQDVLIWYYLEDMSTEQIAVLANKSIGNVRVMIHRGLEALRNEIKEQV
ncbi:MAG: hypothetical protein A2908_01590 [Candidatus Staskawiczbacteria bacterium RIFCSPLOWO2_01_FULL_38_12b]|uniref:RNA polymerase sigma factor n=1 Tax=Candidatus Staskawiczbacteria bacterium RIFCSPLOWO2_01_FULL_38_12b TaxID=1802214 RepID=A0A1G2ICU4_9BACT|nr:MAG: hypothetical protein A2908_01590 [Candidatus Staskawiczbacteria bacterium RIFCSPLOWO2_01_FULL_38_12b]